MRIINTRHMQSGFTFIEILVVTILIGVLASIVMISFVSSGETTRDARRKKDLAALQAALEVYKLNEGAYPDHTGCSVSATWPGCETPWVPGMDETYISQMPVDPKQNTSSFIANSTADTYTYNYIQISDTSYRIIARLENEEDSAINGSSYGFTGERIYVVSEPR